MRPQKVYIFILRLLAWPFSGLVCEAASPPVNFIPTFWGGCNQTFFFFYKVYSNTLGIFLLWILIHVLSAHFFRDMLLSWGFLTFSISPMFSEGILKLSGKNINHSRASWLVYPIQYPWGSLLLLTGLWPSHFSYGGVSVVSYLSLSSWFIWEFSKVSRRSAPRLWVMS